MLHALLLLSLTLLPTGEIDALKGKIVHTRGVLWGIAEGRTYTHRDPETIMPPPKGAETVAAPEVCQKDKKISVRLPLGELESAVAQTQGAIGTMAKATVLLVRGEVANDMFGYAAYFVRVYDEGELVASYEMAPDSYPCTVVLDDFDGDAGNEIAVGWLSAAAGYTAGATIFKVGTR